MPLTQTDDSITKWNDADVFGDLNSRETQSLLDRHFEVMVGLSSKQKRGTWRSWPPTLRGMLEFKLTHHPAVKKKDGHAMVFAKARLTGEAIVLPDGTSEFELCGRTRDDIEAVTFAGFDIDDGDALEDAIGRLKELGYFAVLYTTHSHGKTISEISYPVDEKPAQETFQAHTAILALKPLNPNIEETNCENGIHHVLLSHDPIDKYRILFPLEEPFELAPDDPCEHERRCQEWRERLVNFANQKLNLAVDESGCDVNRLFFTPRHKPNDTNWYSAIFCGKALRVDEMPYVHSTSKPRKRRGRRGQMSLSDRVTTISGLRPILSDGFDLIDWHRKWGTHFQVRELLDYLQWEVGSTSDARREARVICPSDHLHSSQGDVMGCWVKDGTGATPFVIFCHHQTCKERGALDQLVELERYAALPDEFETLSELLCDPSLYDVSSDDEGRDHPDRDSYLRWDPQEAELDSSDETELEVTQ